MTEIISLTDTEPVSTRVGEHSTDTDDDKNDDKNNVKDVKYEFKKKIARRINKITDKKVLVNVLKIIKTLNPDIAMTVNDNGVFIKFNELTSKTYTKLDNYLHKINVRVSDESDNFISTEYIPYTSEEFNASDKLSNKEKTLIKKQIYSSQIATL
jgi:hypothetical protein